MKPHPILFSDKMVRALLDGRKTQTRRILKPAPAPFYEIGNPYGGTAPAGECYFTYKDSRGLNSTFYSECPYGKPGETVLWVRETFGIDLEGGFFYRAGNTEGCGDNLDNPWKPSIFMPRRASRLTLELTDVRVERVQDISEADAKAEGYASDGDEAARIWYGVLWDEINGYGEYAKNPWVWVLEFVVHQKNVDAL